MVDAISDCKLGYKGAIKKFFFFDKNLLWLLAISGRTIFGISIRPTILLFDFILSFDYSIKKQHLHGIKIEWGFVIEPL